MKKTTRLISFAVAASLALTGCSSAVSSSAPATSTPSSSVANKTLTVGASPSPHAEILEQVKEVLLAQGIELVIKEFDDYVLPNTALDSGDLDANFFQHQPYLDDFNTQNGTNIVTLAPVHYEPLGIYAGKTTTLEEIKDGAVIGIPSDNTNGARALQLLEANGIITLKEGAGLNATELDIDENPHNVKIQALEAAQLPISLQDLDFAVINGNYAVGANISESLLTSEAKDSEAARTYSNILCIREGDEDNKELLALRDALLSEEISEFITTSYDGVAVPSF